MKSIFLLMGALALLLTTGCEEHEHHRPRGGFYGGGAYENYPSYGHGAGGGYNRTYPGYGYPGYNYNYQGDRDRR